MGERTVEYQGISSAGSERDSALGTVVDEIGRPTYKYKTERLGATFQKRSDQDWRDYFKFEREKYADDERRRKYVEERQKEQNEQDQRRRAREEMRASNQRSEEYRESNIAESKRRRLQGGRGLPPNGNPPARLELIVASARTVPAAEPQIDATVSERKGYLSADERETLTGLPVPISAEYREMLSAPASQPIAPPPSRTDANNARLVGALAAGLVVGSLITWAWHKLRSRKSREGRDDIKIGSSSSKAMVSSIEFSL